MVQGAAAEFFKTWAAIVRARLRDHDARLVLCLHDEVLVDAPAEAAADDDRPGPRAVTLRSVSGRASDERPMSCGSLSGSTNRLPRSGPWRT